MITTIIILMVYAYIRERIREKYARVKAHTSESYIVGNAS